MTGTELATAMDQLTGIIAKANTWTATLFCRRKPPDGVLVKRTEVLVAFARLTTDWEALTDTLSVRASNNHPATAALDRLFDANDAWDDLLQHESVIRWLREGTDTRWLMSVRDRLTPAFAITPPWWLDDPFINLDGGRYAGPVGEAN